MNLTPKPAAATPNGIVDMRFEHLGTGHQARSSNWGEGPSAKSEEVTEANSPSTDGASLFVVKKRLAEVAKLQPRR